MELGGATSFLDSVIAFLETLNDLLPLILLVAAVIIIAVCLLASRWGTAAVIGVMFAILYIKLAYL